MENQKTKMETAREECRMCGSDGIRTTITHPTGCVQVLFNCLNLDCSLAGRDAQGAETETTETKRGKLYAEADKLKAEKRD